jgi:hypothetical protein
MPELADYRLSVPSQSSSITGLPDFVLGGFDEKVSDRGDRHSRSIERRRLRGQSTVW